MLAAQFARLNTQVGSCEAAAQTASDLHDRYFPLLSQPALDAACAADGAPPAAGDGAMGAAVATPYVADSVFAAATSGLSGGRGSMLKGPSLEGQGSSPDQL